MIDALRRPTGRQTGRQIYRQTGKHIHVGRRTQIKRFLKETEPDGLYEGE